MTEGDTGFQRTRITGPMGPGQVVGSWMTRGEPPSGEARTEYVEAVATSSEEAMDALTDQQVPADQRDYVRSYFDALRRGQDPR